MCAVAAGSAATGVPIGKDEEQQRVLKHHRGRRIPICHDDEDHVSLPLLEAKPSAVSG